MHFLKNQKENEMDAQRRNEQLEIIKDAFGTCLNGISGASVDFFGVDSFTMLVGKKFYFFCDKHYMLKNDSKAILVEAFVGQVTGVKIRLFSDLMEFSGEKSDWKKYLADREAVRKLKGQSCLPLIQTTIGELVCFTKNYCFLDVSPERGRVEGSVSFVYR